MNRYYISSFPTEENESTEDTQEDILSKSLNFPQQKFQKVSQSQASTSNSFNNQQRITLNQLLYPQNTQKSSKELNVLQPKTSNRSLETVASINESTRRTFRGDQSSRLNSSFNKKHLAYLSSDSTRYSSGGRKSVGNSSASNITNKQAYNSLLAYQRHDSRDKLLNNNYLFSRATTGHTSKKPSKSSENVLSQKLTNDENSFIGAKVLEPSEIAMKYGKLLKAFEELARTNTDLKESLKCETLRNEEQRAYIESLKHSIKNDIQNSGLISILKAIQNKLLTQLGVNGQEESQAGKKVIKEIETLVSQDYVDFFLSLLSIEKKPGSSESDKENFQKELKTLEEKLHEVLDQKNKLQSGIDFYKTATETAERGTEELRKAIEVIHNQNLKLHDEKMTLIKYIQETQEENKTKETKARECERLKQELEKIVVENQELKKQCKNFEKRSEQIAKEKSWMELDLKQKQDFLKHIEKEKTSMLGVLKKKEEIINNLHMENNNLTLQCEENVKQNKSLENNINILRENCESLAATLEEAQIELENSKDALTFMQNEIEEKDKKIEELSEKSQINEKELINAQNYEKLKVENSILVDEIMKLSNELNNMANVFKEAQMEAYNIQGKLKSKDQLIEVLMERVNTLEKDCGLLKDSQDPISEKNDEKIEEIKKENEEIVKANVQKEQEFVTFIEEIRKELAKFVESFKEMNESSGSKLENEACSNVEDENKVLEVKRREVKDTIVELKEEIKTFVSKYKNIVIQLEELQTKKTPKQPEEGRHVKKLVEELSQKKEENKGLIEERDYLMHATIELDKQLTIMELKTQALTDELNEFKKKQKRGARQEEKEEKEIPVTNERKGSLAFNTDMKEIDILTTPILKGFIFNDEVTQMIEEIEGVHQEIFDIQKDLAKLQGTNQFESSQGKIIFTEELSLDMGEENTIEEANPNKTEKEEKMLNLLESLLKRKAELEIELSHLQTSERKKYDKIDILEKQNLDLKDQLNKLSNDLEISNSVWPDSIDASQCHGFESRKDSMGQNRVLNTSLESARDPVIYIENEEDSKINNQEEQ